MIANAEDMKAIRRIHDYTGLCAATIFQSTIADYLLNSNFGKTYTTSLRLNCKRSYTLLKDKICSFGFNVVDIQGGYFLWAELPPQYRDGFQFAMELYKCSEVAIVPGENFSPNKQNYVRLNVA